MKQITTSLTIIYALFALISCGQKKESNTTGNHDIQVKLTDVKEVKIGRNIQIHGLISSAETAWLSFKVPGIIRSIRVKEGDVVKKGALLAELDLTEMEAQYTQAQEDFEKQARDHKRVKTLYHDSIATQEQWQNSRTALILAEQALKVAGYNRQNASIYAASDGVVLSKNCGEGEYINPGTPVVQLSLHTDKEYILRAGVSVSDWLNLSIGDKVEWEAEAFPGEMFPGKVKRVAQAADLQSGLYQVEVALHSAGKRVAVGMFAKAFITSQKQSVYKAIPGSCLHDGEGRKAFVYIPDGKNVKKIPVTVDFIQQGQAYISAGLDSIDRVIHEGSGFLSPYSTISIQ